MNGHLLLRAWAVLQNLTPVRGVCMRVVSECMFVGKALHVMTVVHLFCKCCLFGLHLCFLINRTSMSNMCVVDGLPLYLYYFS